MNNRKTHLWAVTVALSALSMGMLFVFAAYYVYWSRFGGLPHGVKHDEAVAADLAAWGQFGDFVGGTVNPLLGFLSLLALLYTVYLQTRQLGLSRQELHLTRDELKRSADAQDALLEYAKQTAVAQQEAASAQRDAAKAMHEQALAAVLGAQAQSVGAENAWVTAELVRASALGIEPNPGKLLIRHGELHKNMEAITDRLLELREHVVKPGPLVGPPGPHDF